MTEKEKQVKTSNMSDNTSFLYDLIYCRYYSDEYALFIVLLMKLFFSVFHFGM